MNALLRQLEFELDRSSPSRLTSVYIGGGTPSTLGPRHYEPLFERFYPLMRDNTEITIEANPNSASKEWLEGIKKLGATRISFGVQSFDDAKLAFLGRAHDSKEAVAAVENAATAGFEHINVDLIYDTAKDTKTLLERDIAAALALPIDHISAYALILEDGTPFAHQSAYKKDDDNLGYFVKSLIPFEHYEVSNFGSYRSRHNIGYWRLEEYIGVGCGAVGFIGGVRRYPQTDLHAYIRDPLAIDTEPLGPEELRLEKIFLGLRSIVGVDKELVDMEKAQILLDEKRLLLRDGRLYNPNFFLADELALFLS